MNAKVNKMFDKFLENSVQVTEKESSIKLLLNKVAKLK